MTDDLEKIGLAAVDRFIETWNSRDAEAWAASLNFPHVRPGPLGAIVVAKDAAEYISRVDFDRVVATGWDHSEWDYRQVVHTSIAKIHVVGQWSRYNKAGEKILANPVTYIVTRVDGDWGIQSRFSADDPGEEDTTSMESRVFKLIETFVTHSNASNQAACAELLNYPHFGVGIGSLAETDAAAEFSPPGGKIAIDSLVSLQSGRRSMNAAMDITLSNEAGGRPMQAIVNVTERDEHLGIQAWSLLDPNAEDQE